MSVNHRSGSSFVIINPLAGRDRAFLRMLRDTAGGRMQLVRLYDRERAEACEDAGYCSISIENKCKIVTITPDGVAYLHKLMGAH